MEIINYLLLLFGAAGEHNELSTCKVQYICISDIAELDNSNVALRTQCQSVCLTTTLVQTKVSQQILNGLPRN